MFGVIPMPVPMRRQRPFSSRGWFGSKSRPSSSAPSTSSSSTSSACDRDRIIGVVLQVVHLDIRQVLDHRSERPHTVGVLDWILAGLPQRPDLPVGLLALLVPLGAIQHLDVLHASVVI